MPGTYTFRPIQANLTHDTDWLGKMDPYCSYRSGPTKIKGPICRNGGKFPKWEDATVNVPAGNEPSMVVDLMDKDKILFDDNIGSFVIDLYEVQSMRQLSKWYPIYYKQKPAGEILMEAAYQPEIIQQPVIVQEPVLVKKVVEEPIIVKETIVEKVPVPVPTTHTHQEFTSGPIIHGVSHIHHGGEGHGLVSNHGPILTEGSHLTHGTHHHHHDSHLPQGTLNQGTFTQGTNLQQGSYLPQGGLNQGNLNQGSYQPRQF